MLAKLKQFVAPPQFPEDDEKARVANLLNMLLWMFVVVFLLLTAAVHFVENEISITLQIAAVPVLSLLLLYVLRRRYVRVASWLTLAIFYAFTMAAAYFDSGLNMGIATSLMMMGVLVGLTLGRRVLNVYAVLTVILGGLLVYLEAIGQIVVSVQGTVSIYLSAAASFIVLVIALNSTLRDMQNAFNRMRHSNTELQTIQEGLEQTVADRTRDLALAAEVGRSLSQIRELDGLLQHAVNTIQEQFDLYYVQIYLADKKQQFLSLKTGTGIVGQQLARRGHSLSFGVGSINGVAAAEKRPVLVADTAASPIFKPNTLLPYTRSEMAVPLVAGDQVVGVLNLQSDRANGLSEDNLAAFEALAGQIAIAIENANLFAETASARTEIESYLRRVTREGWDSYQDAITRSEAIGIVYEDGTTHQISAAAPSRVAANRLQIPIKVANEVIGAIQLEADDDYEWSAEDKELIDVVASQVGRQSENLRLLNETERYRAEAEQAARRLSGQAWRDYLREQQDRGDRINGFVYGEDEVKPLTEDALPPDSEADSIQYPVKIHNEVLAEFVITGGDQEEAQTMLAVVANQLSRHIENIRLAEQTESALGQTESLYQIGHELNAAANVDEILHAALGPIFPTGIDEATLMFIEVDPQGEPQTLELLAGWRLDGTLSFPVGTVFPMQRFPFTGLFINEPNDPQLIGDAATDSRVDDFTRGVMAHAGIQAIAVIPLTLGGQWVGIITCSWSQPRIFSRQEEEIFNALINMAAPAVQSQRLYFKTKAQADKEHFINEISQRIQNTVSIESALQTAVKELGKALHTTTQVKLKPFLQSEQNNHTKTENGAVISVHGDSKA